MAIRPQDQARQALPGLMTTTPGMKNNMDISALYHLQTPLDAIRKSTAIALGRTSKTNPAETRQLFQEIDRQAALLNQLVEYMIHHAKTQAEEQESDDELEPFVLHELTINYVERRVTVTGCPVRLTATGVPAALGAFEKRRTALYPCPAAQASLGPGIPGRPSAAEHLHPQAPQQAGGQRPKSHLHLHRTTSGVLDGQPLKHCRMPRLRPRNTQCAAEAPQNGPVAAFTGRCEVLR